MNLERLRWGEWIAGIAALDLLLVTFRAWYKVTGGNGKVSAWDALSNGRYLLLATAVVGLLLLILVAAEQTEQLSFPFGALVALLGLGCTVYIAYRMATPPADTLDAGTGLYFGLASALGVAVGGLISAREAAAPAYAGRDDSTPPAATFTGPTGSSEPALGALVPDTAGSGTWSPAPPTPAPNWSPAAPGPATAAGAAYGTPVPAGERPLQVGDDVALTAGGARFPAGTIARVIEVFGGGALVEVTAADGVPERFEVPEEAFERLGALGAPAAGGEGWSPAMPAPVDVGAPPPGEDWGFDEDTAAAAGTGTAVDEPSPAEPAVEKVPFWKREIGGKKKREAAAAEAGASSALAAASIADDDEGAVREHPSLFKRLFGGGRKSDAGAAEAVTETSEDPVPEPAADAGTTAGIVDEPAAAPDAEVAVDSEPEPEPEPPEPVGLAEPDPEPEPEPPAPEPVVIAEPEPEPEPPAPEPPAPEPEVVVDSAPEPEPEPPAPEPVVIAEPEPEPDAPAHEPEVVVDSEPVAPEPEVVVDSAPEPEPAAAAEEEAKPRKRSSGSRKVPTEVLADPEPPAPEPEIVPEPEGVTEPEVVPDPEPEVAADPDPEPAAAAEEEPAPKPRKRSSGSRKVPKDALAASGVEAPPVVGDQVQLKVGGGKYDAGTRGVVVDVFSAGVIVELVAEDGRTERLDLPFEAVGPADA